jgi:hypothetical protein
MRAVKGNLGHPLQYEEGGKMEKNGGQRWPGDSLCSRNAQAGFSCSFSSFGFSGSDNQTN